MPASAFLISLSVASPLFLPGAQRPAHGEASARHGAWRSPSLNESPRAQMRIECYMSVGDFLSNKESS